MDYNKIMQTVREVIPSANDQECADFIQPMFEVLDEIQIEALDKYPSMTKWINDSFQMVRELTTEFYGREYRLTDEP